MVQTTNVDTTKNRALFSTELSVACYTFVYLRYIRDGSFLLAAFTLLILTLSDFIKSLMVAYLKRNQWTINRDTTGRSEYVEDDGSEVMEVLDNGAIQAILLRALKYFQVLMLIQTLYSCVYHSRLRIDEDFCENRFGSATLLLIGEEDCAEEGKWFIWFLDVLITFFELIILTNSLTPALGSKSLSIPQLQIHKYGVLSILQMNLWSNDIIIEGFELCVIRKEHSGNSRYGTTIFQDETDEQQDEVSQEQSIRDEMSSLLN